MYVCRSVTSLQILLNIAVLPFCHCIYTYIHMRIFMRIFYFFFFLQLCFFYTIKYVHLYMYI